MTLEELEGTLPNGLHDALLLGMSVDYVHAELRIMVVVDMSTLEEQEIVERRITLRLGGLRALAIEPPYPSEDRSVGSPLHIDAGSGVPSTCDCGFPREPKEGCFVHYIYVLEWNSFIHVMASSATID